MKFLAHRDTAINRIDNKVRNDELWIGEEEYIRDSGRRKGIKMIGMRCTVKHNTLYLHFIGDDPLTGIIVGWLYD